MVPNMYRSNPTSKFAVHEKLSIFKKTNACSDDKTYSLERHVLMITGIRRSAIKNIFAEIPITTSTDRVYENWKYKVLNST